MKVSLLSLLAVTWLICLPSVAQPEDYVWNSPSKNSSESMPCGGGSLGMNVWVENGDILLYVCRSGSFDENNTILKQGRFRIRLMPKLDTDTNFKQTLKLNDGYISISDGKKVVTIWADVYKPVAHVDIDSKQKVSVEASYESWRAADRKMIKSEYHQTSYKNLTPSDILTRHDSISAADGSITFYHRNVNEKNIFDITVAQQGMTQVKSQMYNPLKDLTFGGRMSGDGFHYVGKSDGIYLDTPFTAWRYVSNNKQNHQSLQITLATIQGTVADWEHELAKTENKVNLKKDVRASHQWWNQFWKRSFIECDSEGKEYARNYTLFRYMLGCNAFGEWPTKFNGGLFTFDPSLVVAANKYTPDFRRWGGGTHTAQNQRLVYWPMLKSGDYDAMRSQLDFYLRICHNAELRSQVYWNHGGAAFTEQIENFGLPEYFEYGIHRPAELDKSIQYNAWLEYTWDTVLEFCQMALDANRYGEMNIEKYIPMIQSSLDFFDIHYRYLARRQGLKELDGNGKLVIYPGSGAETFKMAYNPTSTVAGLKTVTQSLLKYMEGKPQYKDFQKRDSVFLNRIPAISFREVNGHQVISPAAVWGRVNNTEPTMLYPVFPWRMFGVGKPGIDIARDTYNNDPYALQFRTHIGWKQDNIWAADLGMTEEAVRLAKLKLADGPYRFPAFWGPGYDWSPDHNWGGSAMIGLQDMLMQEVDGKMLLFPAWPKSWDVHFKLHASGNTTVEATLRNGKLEDLKVVPQRRMQDVLIK